jgi:hypothetical protein
MKTYGQPERPRLFPATCFCARPAGDANHCGACGGWVWRGRAAGTRRRAPWKAGAR